MPVWPAIGNHDVDSPGYDETAQTGAYFDIFTLPARGEAGGVASERESYYSFDVANVHVVVLNSAHPPYLSSPEKGNPMLAWLERDLAATSQEWIIAYWHHPPYGKALYEIRRQQRPAPCPREPPAGARGRRGRLRPERAQPLLCASLTT